MFPVSFPLVSDSICLFRLSARDHAARRRLSCRTDGAKDATG